MLAYRHLFHAGNFADVFKHTLLTRLLLLLTRKDAALCYLDTHAGIGRYDLTHEWAQKLKEYEDGIGRLWDRKDFPELLHPYIAAVRAENSDGRLHYYPGSPRIARRLLRSQDRMVLNELNKDDCKRLTERFRSDAQVQVHCQDGYEALRAYLPPRERRGLVLVDSSFDRSGEFDRMTEGWLAGYTRWATGVYALWYPLMEPMAMHAFERGMIATGVRKILQVELSILPQGWNQGLRGCGMLVINPPFGFEVEAKTILDWLWPLLNEEEQGGVRVRWLVPE
ncbi:MAG: 23S rRNA (adenine(2030)-N(6))-methyltransferase RlmJ [Betaproteobacteria bacterium]